MSEKFNLKWNDFHSNASRSFSHFRNEAYLHDVTLVSDDYKLVSAHKLVLSACSEYFRNILQQTKQSQPLLCLEGVSTEDIKNILDYAYEGQVMIFQENLDRFLDIAQRLKIDGLISNINEEETKVEEPHEVNPLNAPLEEKDTMKQSSELVAFGENGEYVSEEDHKQRLVDNVIVNSDKTATCKVCGKVFGGSPGHAKINAKEHVELHIEGLSYTCIHCEKSFRSKNTLRNHYYRIHKV